MSSVVVLAPNGRRQTVKCTPHTTILQILEEVCKKQCINAEEYDIKHHNKIMDTTVTFRFSGLPNNAQLELVNAKKSRKETDIILAINLENGSRITETFTPNDNLLNILQKVCPENASADKNPVVIYTRREIYGKELENCTLKSLGLVGGRAMIRVLNKDPNLLHKQANVSAPLPIKPVEEKPYIRKFQPVVEEPPKKLEENKINKESIKQSTDDEEEKAEIKAEKNMRKPTTDILKLVKEKRKSEPHNLIHKEKKPMIKKVPTSSTSAAMETDEERNFEDEFVFCGERNGMIFSLESAQSVPSEDLPDEFFDLTLDDAKKILRDVKRQRYELENQMLKTSELRNFEESKKQLMNLNKYKRAIIRVQFPDRTVIQGTFKPTESVQDVVNFIRTYLDDQNMDFYIYTTPPKLILNNEIRLIEAGCVPGALLYFGVHEYQQINLKKEFQNMFTSNSIASLAAAKIRRHNTRKLSEKNEDEFMHVDEQQENLQIINNGASTSADTQNNIERKIISDAGNFPKWFKPS